MARRNKKTDIFKYIDLQPEYPNTCWLWKGGLNAKGEAYFGYNGRKYLAYRFVYWLTHPDWDIENAREFLRHQCVDALGRHVDNRLCCRPDHVIPGTHIENMIDMVLRGRSGLTREALYDILRMSKEFPDMTHGQIAARIQHKHQRNVARQTITDILRGARHRELRDAIDAEMRAIDGDKNSLD